MQRLKKLNNKENVFATYGEGGGGSGGTYYEPRETRMVFRSSQEGMWMANVGIFSGKVYDWLYKL